MHYSFEEPRSTEAVAAGFYYFSIKYTLATQLSSRGWVDPIPDTVGLSPEILGYSRES